MSGIFGIFNRNGKTVDKEIVNTMLDAMSYWEPDEYDTWIDGPIALGHTMLWNTPESKYEHLPLQKDTHILTMDARIDNRDELARELDLPERPMSEIGDSEFILAAYQKWGEECPKYLLGDFAFVIFDEKKQQLFCARDHIGIKSLFYFQNNEFFIFSNDISVLLKHPQIPQDFNEITIANFHHNNSGNSNYSTFFEKIKKIPAATYIIVSQTEISEDTYWRIEESPPIKYKSFEEYSKKLREIFNDAVEVRLRSDYTMASHLSGGIDSSPIAVQAARKLKDRKKSLHVFNWIDIPEEKDRYEYEAWSFSRRISEQEENIIHEEFHLDPVYVAKQYVTHDIFTQGTMYYWSEYYIQEKVKDMNARVILSGWGGDELISYNGYSYISGLFIQGKVLTVLHDIFKNPEYHKYFWIRLIKTIVKSILPSKVFMALRKLIKTDINIEKNCDIDEDMYITDTFSEFLKSQPNIKLPTVKGVRNMQLALYNLGHLQGRVESWFLSSISKRIEYRYPLLDKRIVEFSVGIPEELFYPQKNRERPLFKTAISDLLPLDILWFDKPNEVKINIANRKRYEASIKVLKKSLSHQPLELRDKYYNYDKVYKNLFDLNKDDACKLGNVVTPILFLYAKVRLNKNNKNRRKNNEKNMESTKT